MIFWEEENRYCQVCKRNELQCHLILRDYIVSSVSQADLCNFNLNPKNSPSLFSINSLKITLKTQLPFYPPNKSNNLPLFHPFTTIYLHNIMHPIQLLIKLLHPNPKPSESPLRQTARKEDPEIWMPRFSHSCEKQTLPELQSTRKRQLTQSQKVDPINKHLRLASNSTQKERRKFPLRFAADSPAANSLNSLHLGLVANKSQRVTTISYCLQENNKKRIYSRRKNFFALKKETGIKSTANGVGSQQFLKDKIIKSKVMKLVGKNCCTKTQELHRLAIQIEDDQP